jgi:hypothetical protein
MENEYLIFKEESSKSGVTKVIGIYAKLSNILLGQIKWYGPWRRYAFFPDAGMVFDNNCLNAVIDEIKRLMEERKNAR